MVKKISKKNSKKNIDKFFYTNKISVCLLFLTLIATFLTLFLVKQKQETRQYAAELISNIANLHVQGNQIVNGLSQPVFIHGANYSGTEYSCIHGLGIFDGPSDTAMITAMKSWGINAVRIPLNEDCWLNINGAPPAYSGQVYKDAITNYVNLLVQQNMIPILDLHWSAPGTQQALDQAPMADRDHSIDFWIDVATTFKGNTSVLFDLYNEPYPDSNSDSVTAWQCWRDGGTCPGVSFQAAGMQDLVNAVRGTGATNVLMLGGIEYSNVLSQWLAYKPTDPLNNVVAAWHIYNFNGCNTASCFDATVAPVIAQVPLIAGEVGEDDCKSDFITMVWNWLDQHNANYMPWVWQTWGSACGAKSLITAFDGTPSSVYGVAYKNHLASLGVAPTLSPTQTLTPTFTQTPIPTATPTPTNIPTLTPTPILSNLIKNPSFENTGSNWLNPWGFFIKSGVNGSISHVNNTKVDGVYSADISVGSSNTNAWYMQLLQGSIPVQSGRRYTISFWAKASKNRTITIAVQQNYAPYIVYFNQSVSLTTTWQQYILSFRAPQTDTNTFLAFGVANATGNVWIDKVSMQ